MMKVYPVTKRTSLAEVEAALIKAKGLPALAAQELGLTRQAVWQRIQKSPRLQLAIARMEAMILDAAQSVLLNTITAEGVAADRKLASHNARWLLERKGAHLGFGTKVEGRLADDQVEAILARLPPEQLASILAALRSGG